MSKIQNVLVEERQRWLQQLGQQRVRHQNGQSGPCQISVPHPQP